MFLNMFKELIKKGRAHLKIFGGEEAPYCVVIKVGIILITNQLVWVVVMHRLKFFFSDAGTGADDHLQVPVPMPVPINYDLFKWSFLTLS